MILHFVSITVKTHQVIHKFQGFRWKNLWLLVFLVVVVVVVIIVANAFGVGAAVPFDNAKFSILEKEQIVNGLPMVSVGFEWTIGVSNTSTRRS